MARNKGINVPDPPEVCIHQDYRDSTVEEYYPDVTSRAARVEQLFALGRRPMIYFANVNRFGDVNTYAVRWSEPRGEER